LLFVFSYIVVMTPAIWITQQVRAATTFGDVEVRQAILDGATITVQSLVNPTKWEKARATGQYEEHLGPALRLYLDYVVSASGRPVVTLVTFAPPS
jgi:hypothetical protein